MEYTTGSKVLDGWEIVRPIGAGSYGKVFEVKKTSYGVETVSALKVIRIPESPAEVRSALNDGMDEQSATGYFKGFVDEILHEIAIMSAVKSHPGIVSYEDHHLEEYPGEIRWDILIRMELLTPLEHYLREQARLSGGASFGALPVMEVVRLGQEIADALAFCQRKNIIHRDVKPENIFISEAGRFKLGDFGVAKTAASRSTGGSHKGTERYMAPEVFLNQPYGPTVDLYSLGLVLYRLLNGGRLPFLPPAPKPLSFGDYENAQIRRMQGAPIPPPAKADAALASIVLKACAFRSADRFRSAAEFKGALDDYARILSEGHRPEYAEEPSAGMKEEQRSREGDGAGKTDTDAGQAVEWQGTDENRGTVGGWGSSEKPEGTVGGWGSSEKPEGTVGGWNSGEKKPAAEPLEETVGGWGNGEKASSKLPISDKIQSKEMVHDEPVSRSVFKNILPAMMAMLMVLAYHVVDAFFIGLTCDIHQIAAVSFVTPVFLIFIAAGTIFGIGGASVIFRSLDEGKENDAKKACSFCMWGCILAGTAMTALFLIFRRPVLLLLGTDPDTWHFAKTYLTIVVCGGPFILISSCCTNIIRTERKPGNAMMGLFLGNLLHAVLAPAVISFLEGEYIIVGMAVATVIGNAASAGYYICYFLRGKSKLSISPKIPARGDGVCGRVLASGLPAALDPLLLGVLQLLIIHQTSAYGSAMSAATCIAMNVAVIVGMTGMGAGHGIQLPLCYCTRTKSGKRFKDVFRFSAIFITLALGVSLTVLCFLFAGSIVHVFLPDMYDAMSHAVYILKILCLMNILSGLFYVLVNSIQAMGAMAASLIIRIGRWGMICLLIFSTGFTMAPIGGDIIFVLFSSALLYKIYRKSCREKVG